eukprot:GHVS01026090.1.p1 GENE.GHVS01026090.1~~GHVS01026090.1.p1  ORF type:complete len:676 (-),score=132.52 GHVS01026090.1:503-2305(-)
MPALSAIPPLLFSLPLPPCPSSLRSAFHQLLLAVRLDHTNLSAWAGLSLCALVAGHYQVSLHAARQLAYIQPSLLLPSLLTAIVLSPAASVYPPTHGAGVGGRLAHDNKTDSAADMGGDGMAALAGSLLSGEALVAGATSPPSMVFPSAPIFFSSSSVAVGGNISTFLKSTNLTLHHHLHDPLLPLLLLTQRLIRSMPSFCCSLRSLPSTHLPTIPLSGLPCRHGRDPARCELCLLHADARVEAEVRGELDQGGEKWWQDIVRLIRQSIEERKEQETLSIGTSSCNKATSLPCVCPILISLCCHFYPSNNDDQVVEFHQVASMLCCGCGQGGERRWGGGEMEELVVWMELMEMLCCVDNVGVDAVEMVRRAARRWYVHVMEGEGMLEWKKWWREGVANVEGEQGEKNRIREGGERWWEAEWEYVDVLADIRLSEMKARDDTNGSMVEEDGNLTENSQKRNENSLLDPIDWRHVSEAPLQRWLERLHKGLELTNHQHIKTILLITQLLMLPPSSSNSFCSSPLLLPSSFLSRLLRPPHLPCWMQEGVCLSRLRAICFERDGRILAAAEAHERALRLLFTAPRAGSVGLLWMGWWRAEAALL